LSGRRFAALPASDDRPRLILDYERIVLAFEAQSIEGPTGGEQVQGAFRLHLLINTLAAAILLGGFAARQSL
jgi:hypothetical protein